MNRRRWSIVAALLTLAMIESLGATGAAAQSLAGSWSGMVSQLPTSSVAPNSFYSTVMTLDGSGKGTIDYPSLGCGGALVYIGTAGSGFAYRERLRYGYQEGHRRCIDDGTVVVEPQGNTLLWSWSGLNILASGLLTGRTRVLELSCQACRPNQLRDADACMRSGDIFAQNSCMDRASSEWHTCLSTCRN